MRCYPYRCACGEHWDVFKPLAEIDRLEACPRCGNLDSERYIARTHVFGAGDWDRAEWNPGLGIVTRNARHRRDEAKARGLEEIGNEPVESMHDHFEKAREKKYNDTWDDDRVKLYD